MLREDVATQMTKQNTPYQTVKEQEVPAQPGMIAENQIEEIKGFFSGFAE